MSDEQFRELRTLILNLALQVEELKLRIRSHEEAEKARHEFLAERITRPKIEIVSPDPALKRLFGPDQN